ncbi:XRE family transcriptional regulator [Kitasatospora sp. NBC_01302]|uniref:XRE family transcriptional regulator n=1 Tax=Kitasatospora sp. NBC_01302 TaxID=2903575 RepID=UPI002E100C03|nr:helix-turn-helix domain-containing protein [Kitasatospora sp. NBC_01302]
MTDQLGTLLRRLRHQSGLTQEQVAERSGVSVRTIRRLETGRSADHRLGTVNLLADALDVGPEDRQRLAATLTGTQQQDAVARAGSGAPSGAASAAVVPQAAAPEPAAPAPARVLPASGSAPASPSEHPAPAPVPPPPPVHVPAALADTVQELAREIRRRWRREEEQRQVHDPFPLPVRWQPAPAGLTDRSENIQRLGPGAVPRQVDLSGDLRSVAEVYRRISSGRLVVLGRAGSGKSILTIRFVLDFIGAGAAPGRVPVVFSLGAWDPTTTSLRDWLIARLLRDHPHLARRSAAGSTLAAALVDADLVLPVLDGFDEIAEGLRCEALEALNATSLPLVLTSRRAEFAEAVQAARAPLVWAAGIELTDLAPDDLAGYLPRTVREVAHGAGPGAGGRGALWEGVLAAVRAGDTPAGANLAEVLTTPLMVILARTMYSGTPDRDPAELLDATRFPTARSLEEHLLAGFVPAVYRRRVPEQAAATGPRRPHRWEPQRAQQWLGHLSHHLVRLDHDQQDLAWWRIGDSLRRSTRLLVVVLATTLCVTLADWLLSLLLTGLGIGEVLLQGILMGPVAGLAFGLVYAAMMLYGGGAVFEPAQVRWRLPGTRSGVGRRPLRTFAVRFRDGLLGGSVMGVGYACAISLERALSWGLPLSDPDVINGTLVNMLCFGLIFGLAAALVFGLTSALEAPVDVTSAATPVSLLAANRATVGRQVLVLAPLFALIVATGGRLVVVLLDGVLGHLTWRLSDGLLIGAVAGIGGAASYALAFTAWGQWALLSRVWLPLTGRLPWDTVAFLDDAYHRGVLRQTGAVYQFRHVRLQHHLARTFRQQQPHYRPASFPSAGD